MRPFLTLLLCLLLIGGTYAYIDFADSVKREPPTVTVEFADDAEFFVEIERSFDCEGDAILGLPALMVSYVGVEIYAHQGPLAKDEAIRFGPLENIEAGENEILVSAGRGENSGGLAVVKVVVFRDGNPIKEELISSEPGLPTLRGPVVFRGVEASSSSAPVSDKHDHDH